MSAAQATNMEKLSARNRIALGRSAAALVLLVVIGGHGQAPMLRVRVNADDGQAGNLIGIALTLC